MALSRPALARLDFWRLFSTMTNINYAGYRFPPQIIQQAIWLYLRFTLSFRDVEDLLAERGILVSYETVRRWVNHFGPKIAAELRKRRPKPHTIWHLDEVYLKIDGRIVYLWRAVDAEGEVLDVLVQTRKFRPCGPTARRIKRRSSIIARETGKVFAIGADQDAAVKAAIANIPEGEWKAFRDGEIAETVHCMNKTNKAFRLIVMRRPREQDLFEDKSPYRYHAIASNRANEDAAATMEWYRRNSMKIEIVGAGQVGATAAYAMMLRGVGSEIVLVDRNADLAVAQAPRLGRIPSGSTPVRRPTSTARLRPGPPRSRGEFPAKNRLVNCSAAAPATI